MLSAAALYCMYGQVDSHAARLARFAIDARMAAEATALDMDDPSRGYVAVRIGICSGQVRELR